MLRPAREPVPPARRPAGRRSPDWPRRPLPEPVDVDPAALDEAELARARDRSGCRPRCGRRSTRSLADEVLAEAFGAPLVDSIVAVRESELEELGSSSPEQVADASRWAH